MRTFNVIFVVEKNAGQSTEMPARRCVAYIIVITFVRHKYYWRHHPSPCFLGSMQDGDKVELHVDG